MSLLHCNLQRGNRSAYETLELILKQILSIVNPSREDLVVRMQIVDEFREVVESVGSLRGATVQTFGSFISNLFLRWGDLDISIDLPNGLYISSVGRKLKQNLLLDVRNALRMRGGYNRLHYIPNARVPILKFESIYRNISCDVSINNLSSQMKSKFFCWISEIDRRLRDLVLLVKEWAKTHDINNSKTGSLNSYSLTLLVVFHFQTCVPAILPPLSEIYPGNVADDLTGIRAEAERQIEEKCVANVARYISDKSRALNRSSLSELFVSFLAKFSDIGSMALEQGISPSSGQWEDINSNTRWLPKTYAIFIEDPFQRPENAARSVSSRELTRISDLFRTTHRILISGHQNEKLVLAWLVRPQLSTLLVAPTRFSYNSGGPQSSRATQPHLQKQFQKMKLEAGPSRTNHQSTRRPPRASQQQPQQIWKPRTSNSK